jgi:ribosomal protein L23
MITAETKKQDRLLQVILAPLITEKATTLADEQQKNWFYC